MAQMVIRGIDEKIMAALKARARNKGVSVEGEARAILADVVTVQSQRESVVKELKAFHAKLLKKRKGKPFPDSTPMIRRDRATRD